MSSKIKDTRGNVRWIVVTLLFFSTTINYLDRQVIGYLKPILTKEYGWTNTDFAYITSFFTAFYAGVTLVAGWVIDRIGTKAGLALALFFWSLMGMLNAVCGRAVYGHIIVRSLFGIGEAANFPASIKTVAEWFPKKERALATGIFNSGANVGAMIAAIAVPWIATTVWFGGSIEGWRMAFLITGAIGLIWLFFWAIFYHTPVRHKKLSAAEFKYIHSDDLVVHAAPSEDVQVPEELLIEKAKVPWSKMFSYRQTWAFLTGKFLTDGVWWFLLFWLPDYLIKQFGLTPTEVRWPAFIVYGVAIFGSVSGGGLPMYFINRGMEAYRARMKAMLIIAFFPTVLILTQYVGNRDHFGVYAELLAIVMICIGAAAHQAWSANIFTTVSDMFPKKAVGSVTGIGSMAGGVGGVLLQLLAGHLTDVYISNPQIAYTIMFAACAFAYLVAWGIMKALVPRYKAVTL